MRSLNDMLTRLSALRAAGVGPSAGAGVGANHDRLTDLQSFGSNPGSLRARIYIPRNLDTSAPLVIVLHGCTQNAASYDRGSGWSSLADEQGFALLYPEQQRANNANLCFNWFDQQDIRRDCGEALSIRQMVAAMISEYDLDPTRVYVTGLSAGGAMASVMLATYPEVFAGGAIIAGLPYGTASSVPEAFDRMRAHGGPPAAALAQLVRSASDHQGPWPTVSVWHGERDATVSFANASLVVEQWRALHGAEMHPTTVEVVAGHPRRVWRDATGREVIEEFRIAGIGHGTPLHTSGADACGAAGPYMLEAGISSTRHIARFWGLIRADRATVQPIASGERRWPAGEAVPAETTLGAAKGEPQSFATNKVGGVIEDALRAAGLMP